MKLLKNYLLIGLVLSSALFVGCKKDKDAGSGTYKVKFVGTLSAGSSIQTAVIGYGVSNTSFTDLTGTSWTKEIDLTDKDLRAFSDNPTKNISFGLSGEGRDANSTGKVEIFVNGTLAKTGEGTGSILSPQATYIFD